jgi:hypothetical protein
MENHNEKESSKLEPKLPTISSDATPPSGSAADQRFPVTFGLVVSCRFGEVQGIRESVQKLGVRIIYQTTSEDDLFLFKKTQVERALRGDVSALVEIHKKKERR